MDEHESSENERKFTAMVATLIEPPARRRGPPQIANELLQTEDPDRVSHPVLRAMTQAYFEQLAARLLGKAPTPAEENALELDLEQDPEVLRARSEALARHADALSAAGSLM
jgi:hypothetical protein